MFGRRLVHESVWCVSLDCISVSFDWGKMDTGIGGLFHTLLADVLQVKSSIDTFYHMRHI